MTEKDQRDKGAVLPSRRSTRLRTIGFIVLAVGIASACVIYWLGARSADLTEDPSMAGYSKPQARQMELMYGKMGAMIEDLFADLKRPGIQAIIVAGSSALVAF